jgi:hypothetical protein
MRPISRVRDSTQTDLKREFRNRGHTDWQLVIAALLLDLGLSMFWSEDDEMTFATQAREWATLVSSGSGDILACGGCCLKRLVSWRGPRKTATIGVRPVLFRAWKWQRFRDRCQHGSTPQSDNVCRQRENARTAYYDDGKREEQFLRQSHLLTRCLICLSALKAPCPRVVGTTDTPATVSGRLRQGPEMVSLRAEIIHHEAAAAADRGFKLLRNPRENNGRGRIARCLAAMGTTLKTSGRRLHVALPVALLGACATNLILICSWL